MKSYVRREVLCPFYHREEQRWLFCEGPEEGVDLRLSFSGKTAFDRYLHCYCLRDWDRCRVAEMLERKYDPSGRPIHKA